MLSLLLPAVLPVGAGATSGNMIPNPQFAAPAGEGHPDHWALDSGNGAGEFKLVPLNDGHVLQIKRFPEKAESPSAISGGWNVAEMIPAVVGQRLVATVQAKGAESAKASIALQYRDKNNEWIAYEEAPVVSLGRNWQELSTRSIVPPNAAYAQVVLNANDGTVQFKAPALIEKDWLADAKPAPHKLFFINMDYADMVVFPLKNLSTYREKEIADFFANCKRFGVDGVLWRISNLGHCDYHTKSGTRYPGREDRGKLKGPLLELANILDAMDPLEVAIREGKKQGIKVFVWVTISDEYTTLDLNEYPYLYNNNLVLDHPEYALLSKEGKPMLGTLDYNEPAVREYRLNMLRELIDYQADGIYLCTRTHSFYHNTDEGLDYGYHPAVVAKFKELYGIDVLTEPFDKQKWLELRTEGYTTFIREAAEIVHGANQKLWLGVATTLNENMGWPYGDALLPWKTWIKQGWLDGLVTGKYYTPIGQLPAQAEAFTQVANDEQTLILWQQGWHYQEEHFTPIENLIEEVQAITLLDGIDGLTFHEAHNLESQPDEKIWQPLADAIKKYWPREHPPR